MGVFNLRKRLHGFVHARARGNHIFDDDDVGLFGVLVADEHTAFTVVLCLFAVVGEREVLCVNVAELHRGGGAKRDALVGRTVQVLCLAVKMLHIGCRIELGKLGKRCAGAELSGIDEIRSFTAALGDEVAELERACFYEKMNELIFGIHSK